MLLLLSFLSCQSALLLVPIIEGNFFCSISRFLHSVVVFCYFDKNCPRIVTTPSRRYCGVDFSTHFLRHRGTGRSAPRNTTSGTEERCLPRCRTMGSVAGMM